MKLSSATTGHERIVPPGEILVSRTDLNGAITYANSLFSEISGFTQEELLGRSHSIVRHPGMPAAVFADLWQTLKSGAMWHGTVKNRCKNGDHYWVDALVLPIIEDGITVGYLSTRRQATASAIEKAESHYQALNAGTTRMVRPWKFRLDRYLSIRSGVLLGIAFVTVMILLGAAIGLGTISKAEHELGAMHRENVVAGETLGRIKFLMADNRTHIILALLHDPKNPMATMHGHPIARHLGLIEKNSQEIAELWVSLRNRLPPGEATVLADAYWAACMRYIDDGLLPAIRSINKGKFRVANTHVNSHVNNLYMAANLRADELMHDMLYDSGQRYASERTLHKTVRNVVFIGIFGVLSILAVSGVLFFRGVVGPLNARIHDLQDMSEGKLGARVDIEGRGELGKLNRAFATAQAKLQYLLDNAFHNATQLCGEGARLKTLALHIGDGIEDQHERAYRVLQRIEEWTKDIGKLSEHADALMARAEQKSSTDTHIDNNDLTTMSRGLVTDLRVLSFTADEIVREMIHINEFLVDDRAAMHDMWTAAERLGKTATSLETAAGYFEIG